MGKPARECPLTDRESVLTHPGSVQSPSASTPQRSYGLSLFGTGRKEAALAIGMLILLAVIVHSPGLFCGAHRGLIERSDSATATAVDTQQLEGATNQTVLWPAMLQAGASVEARQYPQWNSTARFGEPLSFSGAHIWYPPYWILMGGTEPWRLDLLLCLHTILAAVTMFRCLQAMTLSRYVAFIGGATYGFGWFMTGSLDRLPEAAAAAILPLAVEQCWRSLFGRPHYSTAPILGLAIGLMFATGGTSTAWFGSALCICYFLFSFSGVARDQWPRLFRSTGTSILVAGLMTAPLWLDSFQHSGSRMASAEARVQHLQPAGLFGIVAPGLFGSLDGKTPEVITTANPGADPLELLLYPGAMVLFLALLGLLRPKRNYHSVFWIAIAGLGLILTLDSPLSSAFANATSWHPERPGASLVLVHFAFVVLAAMGLENFFDAPMTRRIATPIVCWTSIVIGFTVLGSALFYPAPIEALVSSLVGHDVNLAVERDFTTVLLPFAQPAIALIAISILFLVWRRLGIMRFKPALSAVVMLDLVVLALTQVPRVEETMSTELASGLPATDSRVTAIASAQRASCAPLAGTGPRTLDAEGPYMLERSASYLRVVDPSMVNSGYRSRIVPLFIPQLLEHPLMSLAGIDTAIATKPFHSDSFRPLAASPLAATATPDVYVAYRDLRSPRAKIYYKTLRVSSADAAKLAIEEHAAELSTLLVLERTPAKTSSRVPEGPATITWREDTPNLMRLDVSMRDGRGYLLLTEAYAEGWEASVDGISVPIHPAQLAFRSIALAEGNHEVVFRYAPWALSPGLWLFVTGVLTALTLLLLGPLLAWCSRRRARAAMATK